LLAALCVAPVAGAQPEQQAAPEGARPRIGLVLSGGGARGAAHIGVIEVLEQLRVPVDVVSGTSMGSVVGGLYAAGLSPEELSQVIQSVDWVRVFDDKPDRQVLSYRRKEDDRTFLTNLRLGFKNGSFFIPPGMVEGQKLDYLLRTLTLGSEGVARFEDLRLPFRAIATDINTGEAVILETGTLATAQRASMSIPAAFSPVELDGRLLVDGYVANNLPIDAAQGLGADAVIAVDISTPLSGVDANSSAFAINAQASGFSTQENQRRQKERLAPNDILLTPELGDLGAASFPRMQEAIDAGHKAAEAAAESLSRYSVSEQEYAAWRAQHRRAPPQLPVVDENRIENDSLLADALIRARVHARAGEPLDLAILKADLNRLFGLDAFERVQFDLRRESGRMVLVYHVEARLRGINYFRIGLNLETDFANEAGYNLGINHVMLPLNAWGAELRSYFQAGDTYKVSTELYQPVDARDWFFVQPQAAYELRDFDVFQDGHRLARFDLETLRVGFELGVNLGNFAQLRGGIGYLDGETDRESGDPLFFSGDRFSGGFYQATFEYDTLDNTRFPNDGAYGRIQGTLFREELGFRDSSEELQIDSGIFRTLWRNTLGLALHYSTSFDASDGIQFLKSLGGFANLSAFERGSIVGPTTGLARLSAYRRIASPSVFAWEFPVYLGAQFEVGNAWQDRGDIDDDLLYSTGPFFGVDTPLGPLYISYAYGEGGEHQGYLYLGQPF
jgi:NTE family protein